MRRKRVVAGLGWVLIGCLLIAGCAGREEKARGDEAYETERVFSADAEEVWHAAMKTLPRQDYFIRFMSPEAGVIRATHAIEQDPESLILGRRYEVEISIRQLSSESTRVTIEPYFEEETAEGLWTEAPRGAQLSGLERDLFDAIEASL